MKKILLLSLSLLILACTNMNTSTDESKEAQISRLLKEADKKKEETVEVEKTVVTDNGEEITEEETTVQNKKSHKGMTRGEIMEYEMTRVSDEMNALQADVQEYQEKKAQLKAYQEKLQKLEELNNAGIK
ncbi:defensin-inducing lipoprotein FAD-I [Fusobacterium sp. oral taxon 370]|uniref:defensin-inducing lipoprotein FAD-I n=1 Tax=Fusobacterium sp. oral taxon 370 TaxID=712288 RepID=UPI0002F3798F|nr:defensin-inducing lipoprotein FAD-I [Fusobacterium sp. oral taxon 370]